MANLYELGSEFDALVRCADNFDSTDEELAELLQALDESRLDFKDKVDRTCRLIANVTASVTAHENEARRLEMRAKTLKNKRESLQNWVRYTMDALDIRSIKTDVHSVTLSPGQARVEVVDLSAIPSEYVRTTTTTAADKRAILKAYEEDGECIPGTDIVAGKPRLTIR